MLSIPAFIVDPVSAGGKRESGQREETAGALDHPLGDWIDVASRVPAVRFDKERPVVAEPVTE